MQYRFQRIVVTLVWLALLPMSTAGAQPQDLIPSSFKIDDKDPVSSVPTPQEASRKPLEMGYFLMNLEERAQAAEKAGDHSQAAKYYRAMAKAVPERSVGFARACEAHAAAQEWDLALEVCKVALSTEGVKLRDHALYIDVMLRSGRTWSPTDVEDVDAVLARLREHADDNAHMFRLAADNLCRVAVKLADESRLIECNQMMARIGPNEPKALTYASALAVLKGDWAQAERILKRARDAGLPAEQIAAWERTLAAAWPKASETKLANPVWIGFGVGVLLLSALAVLVVRGRMRRSATAAQT